MTPLLKDSPRKYTASSIAASSAWAAKYLIFRGLRSLRAKLTLQQLIVKWGCSRHGLVTVQVSEAVSEPLPLLSHLLVVPPDEVHLGLGLCQLLLQPRHHQGQPGVSLAEFLPHLDEILSLGLLPGDLLPEPGPDLLLHGLPDDQALLTGLGLAEVLGGREGRGGGSTELGGTVVARVELLPGPSVTRNGQT